jgi:uncharacterized Tic20 family protein
VRGRPQIGAKGDAVNQPSTVAGASGQEEKIMAAIGHATIIWPVMGIIAPLVVWATQRQRSSFVGFQALQAAVYHATLILAGLACGACYFCAYLGMILGIMSVPVSMFLALPPSGPTPEELPPAALIPVGLGFVGMIIFYLAIFGLLFLGLAVWGAYVGYGLYGAVASLQGKDFRYAIIGPRLERYLRQT